MNEIEIWHLVQEEGTVCETAAQQMRSFVIRRTAQLGELGTLAPCLAVVVPSKKQMEVGSFLRESSSSNPNPTREWVVQKTETKKSQQSQRFSPAKAFVQDFWHRFFFFFF